MKKLSLVIILIIGIVSVAYANIIQGRRDASGGGPDVWYYGSGNVDADYVNTYSYANANIFGDDIPITTEGSITKVGVKLGDVGSSNIHIKISLFDNLNTLHECCTITSAISDSWNDCVLSSPLSVSNSDSVTVEAIISEYTVDVFYAVTSGGLYAGGKDYASACYSSIQGSDDYQHAVRVYVD